MTRSAIATGGSLVVILVASTLLWWPLNEFFVIGSDDRDLMAVSRELGNGRGERLFAPQDVHFVPLYRLVRLHLDLHFPTRFHWMHALTVFAHLSSTLLVFGLSRRFLATRPAALVSAALFTWQSWGGEALIIKSQSTYVLSLPLLLGPCGALPAPGARWDAFSVCSRP